MIVLYFLRPGVKDEQVHLYWRERKERLLERN